MIRDDSSLRCDQIRHSGIQPRAGDGIRGEWDADRYAFPRIGDLPMHVNDGREFLKTLHPIPRLVQASGIVVTVFSLQAVSLANGTHIRIIGGAHASVKR